MDKRYFLIGFFLLGGCSFESSGSFAPIYELGASCLQVNTRFIPTPGGITTGTPGTATPIDIETCRDYAAANDISWTFRRLEPPSPDILEFPLANSDILQLVFDEGVPYCTIKRGLSYQTVNEKGMGTWQVTHQVNDWSVTCAEVEIAECPRPNNWIDFWASYTTVSRDECVQQKLGVDIMEPDYP